MPNPEFGVHITNEVSNQCFQILSLWVWALFVCLFVCLHISVMPIRCPGIGVTANCHQCRREQGADCTEWSGFLLGCITLPLLLHYLSGCSGTSGTSGSIWSFRYYIKFEWGCFFFFSFWTDRKVFFVVVVFLFVATSRGSSISDQTYVDVLHTTGLWARALNSSSERHDGSGTPCAVVCICLCLYIHMCVYGAYQCRHVSAQ